MGHNGILQSLILKSSAVKEMPLIIVTKFYHDIFKTMLKEFLDKNGVEFSENMFQQNFSHQILHQTNILHMLGFYHLLNKK